MGKQTQKDLDVLKERIRKKGHKDLKDALFITAKKEPVAKYNEIQVCKLPGKLYISKAILIN